MCFSVLVHGQSLQRTAVNEYVTHIRFEKQQMSKIPEVTFEKPVSSIAIRYEGELQGTTIEVDGERYQVYPDDHAHGPVKESSLVIFRQATSNLRITAGSGLKGILRLSAIHNPELSLDLQSRQQDNDCEEPDMISQSNWRQGLPAPSTSRSFSTTRNVIVHHAASSNSLTNYTNVVRNIYLFHTQDRGWSDIGYNYLIAQDGTIYAGRDPINGEQDEVIGAHFCGRNTGTMGICLLGNLSEVAPTEVALTSLNNLIAWKVLKDELSSDGIASHPLNSQLPVIAGHRDGCSTQCPGNFTYPLLPTIRLRVQQTIDECLAPEPEEPARVFAAGPNPAFSRLFNIRLPEDVTPDDVSFMNLNGQPVTLPVTYYNVTSMQLDISSLPKGVYILTVNSENFRTREKVIKN